MYASLNIQSSINRYVKFHLQIFVFILIGCKCLEIKGCMWVHISAFSWEKSGKLNGSPELLIEGEGAI